MVGQQKIMVELIIVFWMVWCKTRTIWYDRTSTSTRACVSTLRAENDKQQFPSSKQHAFLDSGRQTRSHLKARRAVRVDQRNAAARTEQSVKVERKRSHASKLLKENDTQRRLRIKRKMAAQATFRQKRSEKYRSTVSAHEKVP